MSKASNETGAQSEMRPQVADTPLYQATLSLWHLLQMRPETEEQMNNLAWYGWGPELCNGLGMTTNADNKVSLAISSSSETLHGSRTQTCQFYMVGTLVCQSPCYHHPRHWHTL